MIGEAGGESIKSVDSRESHRRDMWEAKDRMLMLLEKKKIYPLSLLSHQYLRTLLLYYIYISHNKIHIEYKRTQFA